MIPAAGPCRIADQPDGAGWSLPRSTTPGWMGNRSSTPGGIRPEMAKRHGMAHEPKGPVRIFSGLPYRAKSLRSRRRQSKSPEIDRAAWDRRRDAEADRNRRRSTDPSGIDKVFARSSRVRAIHL